MYVLLFLILLSSFECRTTEQEIALAELDSDQYEKLREIVFTEGNCSIPHLDSVYQHNERIEFGGTVFKCEHEIVMGPLGCISNGVDIELKTIYMEGRYQYQCTDTVGKKLVGCTTKAGGTDTVEVDGEFDDDGLRYVCKADQGIGILGCLDSTGESTVLIEYEDTYISKVITLDEEKGTSIKVFADLSPFDELPLEQIVDRATERKYRNVREKAENVFILVTPVLLLVAYSALGAGFIYGIELNVQQTGYGTLVSCTHVGRAFSVLYTLVGIPLTVLALNSTGRIWYSCVTFAYVSIYRTLSSVGSYFVKKARYSVHTENQAFDPETEKPTGSRDNINPNHGHQPTTNFSHSKCSEASSDRRNPNNSQKAAEKLEHTKVVPISLGLLLIFLWIFATAEFFSYIEGWDYWDSVYFTFITLTTVGLGDKYPARLEYTLVMFSFITIGLALVSLMITIIQTKIQEFLDDVKETIMEEYKQKQLKGEHCADAELESAVNFGLMAFVVSERQQQDLVQLEKKMTGMCVKGVQATEMMVDCGINAIVDYDDRDVQATAEMKPAVAECIQWDLVPMISRSTSTAMQTTSKSTNTLSSIPDLDEDRPTTTEELKVSKSLPPVRSKKMTAVPVDNADDVAVIDDESELQSIPDEIVKESIKLFTIGRLPSVTIPILSDGSSTARLNRARSSRSNQEDAGSQNSSSDRKASLKKFGLMQTALHKIKRRLSIPSDEEKEMEVTDLVAMPDEPPNEGILVIKHKPDQTT